MKKLKIERAICVAVVLMSVICFSWVLIEAYFAQLETGINLIRHSARDLFAIAGVGVLFGAALWALRVKEREAKRGLSEEKRHDS